MSNETICPSSLDGIKRLAKKLKGEHHIHARALDAAAQAAGFQNFRHASNLLRSTARAPRTHSRHRIFLTAYWTQHGSGESGRETLTISLSVPWGDLIAPLQLQLHRSLMDFRSEGSDHLARGHMLRTQSEARRAICAASRALHFMDATKLRPSKSHSRAFPGGQSSNAIPGNAHSSVWYDRETKRYLFVDEPYENSIERQLQERLAWAKQHGFAIAKPEWTGMYAPDIGSRMYLVTDEVKGVPLEPIVTALKNLPAPIIEETWNGESSPIAALFISPGAVTSAEAAKNKPKEARKPSGKRNSVSYVRTFVGPQLRPKGRMTVEAHKEVGRLLKSVYVATYYRKGVYNRVNAIRSELEDWAQCEYSHDEIPNGQFFELYYRESGSTFSRSLTDVERECHLKSLAQVKSLLSEEYPDCPPLRSLLKKLDVAAASLKSWI